MKHWVMKTEPSTFSWGDLKKVPNQVTSWEGVRNYQARNFMRDQMQVGDLVLFYHSVVKYPGIMGIAKVVRAAYPDHFAFDPSSKYYDPQSSPDNPRWLMVDIQHVEDFEPLITLDELRQTKGLKEMLLLQKGRRLSVQPVTPREWDTILGLRHQELKK